MHIEFDDDLIAEVDQLAGIRGRSEFVRSAVRDALVQRRRWAALADVAGSVPDSGHDWDDDPAEWVRAQRAADPRRVG